MDRIKKKRLDFVRANKRKPGRRHMKQYISTGILSLPVICAVVCVVGTVWLRSDAARISREARQMEAAEQTGEDSGLKRSYPSDPKDLESINKWLSRYQDSLSQIRLDMEMHPKMGSSLMEAVLEARRGKVLVDSISFNDGALSFFGETQSVQDPSEYVIYLEETGLFERVEYEGFENQYTARERYQSGPPYHFRVSCVLARDSGEPAAEGADNEKAE